MNLFFGNMRPVTLLFTTLFVYSCIDEDYLTPDPDTPVITKITPLQGPVGTPVIIEGERFSDNPGSDSVFFNGTSALVTGASGTRLETTVPQGATSGPVTVSVNGKEVEGPDFIVEYIADYPSITTIDPDAGVHGTLVNITSVRGIND